MINTYNIKFPSHPPHYVEHLFAIESLKDADVVILENKNNSIGPREAVLISLAMLLRKPIIITHTPTFTNNPLMHFYKKVIMHRASKIFICSVQLLNDSEQRELIFNISASPVNYTLTRHETTLLKSLRKQYFKLLES